MTCTAVTLRDLTTDVPVGTGWSVPFEKRIKEVANGINLLTSKSGSAFSVSPKTEFVLNEYAHNLRILY